MADKLKELEKIIDHQSAMESLWLLNPSFNEAILMAALRHLHAVIEDDPFNAELAKKGYWNLEVEL